MRSKTIANISYRVTRYNDKKNHRKYLFKFLKGLVMESKKDKFMKENENAEMPSFVCRDGMTADKEYVECHYKK